MEAATLDHVEEEPVARQKSVLSNLHTYAFISRLPTETLQDIFIHCARDYHYQHLCPTGFVPSWVNVSYVCRHWRNVALKSPTLWAYLFIISRRWTKVLLARSKQASLKIRVSLVPRQRLSCVGMVMKHVERIQELCLRLPAPFAHRVLSRLSSRAPRLQDLDITVEHPDSRVEGPSSLFDGDTPALRTLKLASCPVPLHSFRLSALTVLHLANVPVQFQQDVEEFLAALSCMQDLKHLYLCHALPSAIGFLSSAVFKTFEKIDLTHLSRLWINAPLETTVTLLSCINIPLKTQVKLECNSELNPSLDHYALLRSLLAQRYNDQAQSNPTILSLVIQSIWKGTSFTFSPRQRYTTMAYGPWDRDILLYIHLDHRKIDGDTIINDICSSMPLSNVETLSVHQPMFSPVFWRRILRQLQDVRYITLSGGNMPSLTDHTPHHSEGEDAQNHGGLASGCQGQSHILVPRLEELELKHITFLPNDGSNLRESAITRDRLWATLSTRRLEGSRGRLTMTRCNIPGSGRFDMVAEWGGGGGCYAISGREYT
ncbi:hypothetical protein L210DRAFT_2613731 [Boletus edulis BED1]|uniref:F-box domain-containing protein n=1 Tax=Boletus edulis BED1 TaxID=1328754 RepID=A0AAD4BAV4_BOLED|nr:hypothetical protein L210DRAFT_2613731 [Boletus edulis BED1]